MTGSPAAETAGRRRPARSAASGWRTSAWAGPGRWPPACLADLGADVLKIESQAHPDWWRGWEAGDGRRVAPRAAPELHRRQPGQARRQPRPHHGAGAGGGGALVAGSDVVIENFSGRRPGQARAGPGRAARAAARASSAWPCRLRRGPARWPACGPTARPSSRPPACPSSTARRAGRPACSTSRSATRSPGSTPRPRSWPRCPAATGWAAPTVDLCAGRLPVPARRRRDHRRAAHGRPAAADRQPPPGGGLVLRRARGRAGRVAGRGGRIGPRPARPGPGAGPRRDGGRGPRRGRGQDTAGAADRERARQAAAESAVAAWAPRPPRRRGRGPAAGGRRAGRTRAARARPGRRPAADRHGRLADHGTRVRGPPSRSPRPSSALTADRPPLTRPAPTLGQHTAELLPETEKYALCPRAC